MKKRFPLLIATLLAFALAQASAQSLTFTEVKVQSPKPLTAAEVKDLVTGAKTEFFLVNGSQRRWTNNADGTFVASRSSGDIRRRTGPGTWSVNDDAAYCLTFDWGPAETETWCRQLYKFDDSYYAYGLQAKDDTRSGRYRFSK